MDSPSQHDEEQESTDQPQSKRPRTALACQRCKSRKQKCDGNYPACSPCIKASSECLYISSMLPKAAEQKLYIKALEERVAELESSLSFRGKTGVADDHWDHYPPQESPMDSLSTAIRDLTLNASGYSYLGGTSNITLARILEPALHSDQQNTISLELAIGDDSTRDPLVTRVFPQVNTENLPDVSCFSTPIIERLFQAYMKHCSIQYPVFHSKELRDMHSRRHKPYDLFEICILHLIYAIGGRELELSGENGDYRSDEHYEAAMAHRSRILYAINRQEIQYLALSSMYCLRAPRSPGPWTMIGLAIKFCVSMGFHRKSCTSTLGLRSELDKRLFWTCYSLDRDVTFSMGRPPTICDHDIDTQFPLDVNEESTDVETFRRAVKQDPNSPANPPTTLTYFVHMLRLKRITSDIQLTIYRVDKNVNASHDIVDNFLEQLDHWKATIPGERTQEMESEDLVSDLDPFARLHLRDFYIIRYYACVRFLLFPQLTESIVNSRYLNICAAACAGVCRSYKQLHQYPMPISYPPVAINSLFLAGLTLVSCIWLDNKLLSSDIYKDALTDCTIMLYVMAERWPKAKKYRLVFEKLKKSVMSMIANGMRHPSTRVGMLDTETRLVLDSIDKDFGGSGIGMVAPLQTIYNNSTDATTSWDEEEFRLDSYDNFPYVDPLVPTLDPGSSDFFFPNGVTGDEHTVDNTG